KIAAEILRNVDDKLHLPPSKQIVSFGFGFHFPDEIEIGAVLHRIKQGPALRALIGQKHRGGQMPRVGVNAVAEGRWWNEWNTNLHAESEPVRPHRKEFLGVNATQPRKREFGGPFLDLPSSTN